MYWNRASNSSAAPLLAFNKDPPDPQPHGRRDSQRLPAQCTHVPTDPLQCVHIRMNVTTADTRVLLTNLSAARTTTITSVSPHMATWA